MIGYSPGRSPAGTAQRDLTRPVSGPNEAHLVWGRRLKRPPARAYVFRPSASTLPGDSGGRTSLTRRKPASVSQAA